MKIVHQDETRLIIKTGNSLGLIVGGIITIVGILTDGRYYILNPEITWELGWFIVILGITTMIVPTRKVITFDRAVNKLIISEKNIFKEWISGCTLSDIKEVDLYPHQKHGARFVTYSLACILKDDTRIPLTATKSSTVVAPKNQIFSWGRVSLPYAGQMIAEFLNVPLIEDRRPLTITETLATLAETFRKTIDENNPDAKKSSQ